MAVRGLRGGLLAGRALVARVVGRVAARDVAVSVLRGVVMSSSRAPVRRAVGRVAARDVAVSVLRGVVVSSSRARMGTGMADRR
ncbi:MAG: hypothetical protein OXG34_15030 [bacterium]|nr:hypothetical protein [bacterium]